MMAPGTLAFQQISMRLIEKMVQIQRQTFIGKFAFVWQSSSQLANRLTLLLLVTAQ